MYLVVYYKKSKIKRRFDATFMRVCPNIKSALYCSEKLQIKYINNYHSTPLTEKDILSRMPFVDFNNGRYLSFGYFHPGIFVIFDLSNHHFFKYKEAFRLMGIISRNTETFDEAAINRQESRHLKKLMELGYHIEYEEHNYTEECFNTSRDMHAQFPILTKKTPITISHITPSMYPFLILRTLEETESSLSQSRIKEVIKNKYQINIPRETIGKHIKILKDYGYPIKHEGQKSGYWLEP